MERRTDLNVMFCQTEEVRDDLSLAIAATWIEDSGTMFDRVVVFKFECVDAYMSDTESLLRTVGSAQRDRVSRKLELELGLEHGKDYIFAIYDNPVMENGAWVVAPLVNRQRIVIRLHDNEVFTMLKMHYND